ncbi:MAG: hypothetical protein H0W50_03180 [Parachlamydiaceae bacterium]|nr:hypothetical protein [Parachlamydiaceae bacterium]
MPHFEPINDDIHFQLELSKLSSWSECKKFSSKNKLVKSNGKTYILLEKREIYSMTIGKFALGVFAVIFSCGISLMFKNVRNLFTGREVKRLAILQTDLPKPNNKDLVAEEKLLPKFGTPIPIDVVKFMLKNLSVAKIARIMELNMSWHQLVRNDVIIQNNIFIATCLARAKNIALEIKDRKKKSDAFKKIIAVEVCHNLIEAKKTLQNTHDASNIVYASVKIAKKEPHFCLKRAKEALSFLSDQFFIKSLAQLEIVKVECQIDLERAKATAVHRPNILLNNFFCQIICLLEVAKVDPEHDLSQVKKIAQDIQNVECQSQSFYEIVKVEAFYDLANAKKFTQSIQDSKFKSLALLEIVKVEVLHDLNLARETAHIEDPVSKTEAYIEIAKADPEHEHDLTQAIFHTHEIPRALYNKIEFFLRIASIDINHDMNMAKEEVKNLHDDNQKFGFLEIVKVEVQYDLANAVQTALEIKDLYIRVQAFIEIAKVDPKHDFSLAKRLAENINNSSMLPYQSKISPNRCDILFQILKAEALNCLSQAKQTLKKIEDHHYRQLALREIIKAEAHQHTLIAAKEIANSIEDPILQLDAYLEIAKFALKS